MPENRALGRVRANEDVDILVEASEDNYRRIIAAHSEMEDGAARELTPRDYHDNLVVRYGFFSTCGEEKKMTNSSA